MPKYNGNIAEVDWVTGTDYNPIKKRYGYVYDGLNRLVAGYYQPENNQSSNEYYERLKYDENGNISELKRTANKLSNYTSANLIDNLGYTYKGNQLTQVIDTSLKSDGYPSLVTHNTILYDANGNMIKHLDKSISAISYNFLNLPNQITQGTTTSYVYRADGLKIKKLYGTKKIDYIDSFQYENDLLQFIPTSEGYYDFNLKAYIYNYTDHLGNVRLSYKAADGGGIEIIEENNYYPFGLKHEGYNNLAGNQSYQYKYNGKELQETGMYDYGARFYMPDIGRWGVVDPLADITMEPYAYANNSPINFIDFMGLSPLEFNQKESEEDNRIRIPDNLFPPIHATDYKNKRTGEIITIIDGRTDIIEVGDEDFARAKKFASNMKGQTITEEYKDEYVDFFYDMKYGKGFSKEKLYYRTKDQIANNQPGDYWAWEINDYIHSDVQVQRPTVIAGEVPIGPGGMSKSAIKSIKSLKELIIKHQSKLTKYILNPNNYDNLGTLKNAPNEIIKNKIIQSRINHLKEEIKTFHQNINKILNGK